MSTQVRVESHLRLAPQACPQLAQLLLVPRVVSQPGWELQSPKPSWQLTIVHWPFVQAAFALAKAQLLPHAPQFATSVLVSTQLVPHLVGAEAVQSETHVCCPLTVEQSGVAVPHAVPHFPQLEVVLSWVSQSGLLVSQFPQPAAQVTGPHAPLRQAALPFITAQLLPQAPQLLAVLSCVSHPGAAVQSPKPSLHVDMAHAPFTQVATAFGKLQTVPQAPQLLTSVLRSTHVVPHLSGDVPVQFGTQVCVPPVFEQSGAVVGHVVVQAPHVAGVLRSVSQTSLGLAEQ